jgi:hypothetical protein
VLAYGNTVTWDELTWLPESVLAHLKAAFRLYGPHRGKRR